LPGHTGTVTHTHTHTHRRVEKTHLPLQLEMWQGGIRKDGRCGVVLLPGGRGMGMSFCSFKLRVHLPGTSHLNTKADKVMPGATNGSNWVLPIMNVLRRNSNSSSVLNPLQDYCIIGVRIVHYGTYC